VSPDCALPLSFIDKWWIQEILPIVIVVLLTGIYFPVVVLKYNMSSDVALSNTISYSIMILTFCYFSVVNNTMSIFNCKFTGSQVVMSSEPSIVCDTSSDQTYAALYAPAIVFAVVYIIGIPLLVASLLYTNRFSIKEDIARLTKAFNSPELARKAGDVSVTIPAVRIKYGFLYEQYKPSCFYWSLVVILR
jgi:hypothetical protein